MGTICNIFLREKLYIHSFIQHIECVINYINNKIMCICKENTEKM